MENPDRLVELWRVAKLAPWDKRPEKADLAPLRTAVHPNEQIVGCMFFLAENWWSGALTVVVTDEYLRLRPGNHNAKWWREVVAKVSPDYLPDASFLRIPLNDDSTVDVGDKQITWTVGGRLNLSLTVRSRDGVGVLALLQSYLARANELARGRKQH